MRRNILTIGLLFAVSLCMAQTYKFAVICDTRSDANNSGVSGVNASAVKGVCNHLKQKGAEIIIAPGDFICGNVKWYLPQPPSNDDQYKTFLDAAGSVGIGLPESNKKVILYPIRGNHECYRDILPEDSIKAAWKKNIGNSLPKNGPEGEVGFTYSFLYKGSLFIGLDQYMHADSTQKKGIGINQKWLDRELKKYPGIKQVFAFGHTPAFAAKHQDCLGEDSIARNVFLQSINNRTGVYFCGHDHFYARANVPVYSAKGGISNYMQQVITPSGAPFLTGNHQKWNGVYNNSDVLTETYIDSSVGYQLVTVDNDKVTVEFIATQDASTYYKDANGVYHYTYNDNWETWNFVTMDKFTYTIKAPTKK